MSVLVGKAVEMKEEDSESYRKRYTKRETQLLMCICALLGFLIGIIL